MRTTAANSADAAAIALEPAADSAPGFEELLVGELSFLAAPEPAAELVDRPADLPPEAAAPPPFAAPTSAHDSIAALIGEASRSTISAGVSPESSHGEPARSADRLDSTPPLAQAPQTGRSAPKAPATGALEPDAPIAHPLTGSGTAAPRADLQVAHTPSPHRQEPASQAAELPVRVEVPVSRELPRHVAALHIDSPVASTDWQREFTAQIVVLGARGPQQAEIRVNPPELGPIHVHLGIEGDSVSVVFAASHADTRGAIQDALPQLHEMLAREGLSLGQSSVSAETPQRESARARAYAPDRPASRNEADAPREVLIRAPLGLVDTFA